MQNPRHTLTSESVSEGHPDKVCDFIADSILDAHLAREHDLVVLAEHLAGDAAERVAGQVGIEDRVGDEVADLVGMALGNGFGRERVPQTHGLSF